eukprot:TRINITY_DN4528_c0_g1_i1.p1 TRINITY_DN4528_c0_g1~~TRINITY_DN4528_c0_g1_i1.p1  ORF type:complete len:729 (-),score=170.63 TRINITY_DN4528_c0_g1_i1:57-2243(-)
MATESEEEEARRQVEETFATLADKDGLVEKKFCREFLQSLGGSATEAEALFHFCASVKTRVNCKEFVNALFSCMEREEPNESPAALSEAEAPIPPAPTEESKAPPVTSSDAAETLKPPAEEGKAPPVTSSDAEETLKPPAEEAKAPLATFSDAAETLKPPAEECAKVLTPMVAGSGGKAESLKEKEDEKVETEEKLDEAADKEEDTLEQEEKEEDPASDRQSEDCSSAGTKEEGDAATAIPEEKVDVEKEVEAKKKCCEDCNATGELFEDPTDGSIYCEKCWVDYYNETPTRYGMPIVMFPNLVKVKPCKVWNELDILQSWNSQPLKGWPPPFAQSGPVDSSSDPQGIEDSWADVKIHLRPGLVGTFARQRTKEVHPRLGEVLCKRFRIEHMVGSGHFTRAYLATDIEENRKVCVKRHNGLTVELLTDLLTVGSRIDNVDPEGRFFAKLTHAFFDMVGYTVEMLLEGRNCLEMCRSDPSHFKNLRNLQIVALGCIRGLMLLSEASVVHCDMKADNFMWTVREGEEPTVRIVDFGCSRLDCRIENGRNWALNENGAGHIGKWAPEMVLRLPVTAKHDVWGHAVALFELYAGRNMWNKEGDTVEYVLAQALGLCNARNGMPAELLRRSPIDIRQLYTPSPCHFPVQRLGHAPNLRFKEFRPARWGHGCVLGPEEDWDDLKKLLSQYVQTSMTLDPNKRPSAADMLSHEFLQSSGLKLLTTEVSSPKVPAE